MNLFIDCEFNEFGGELISLALVASNGSQWYEVLPCLKPEAWVLQNVIPVLGKKSISREYFHQSLQYFLSEFDKIHVIADWPEDIKYFCDALIPLAGHRIDTPPLTMEILRDINSSKSITPHNALADAQAIKLEYETIYGAEN
jgi:hypothetical protein